jgi:hypothetical protein
VEGGWGGIHIAQPRILVGLEVSRATWKRPWRMPQWQRRVRETRLRVRSIYEIVSMGI